MQSITLTPQRSRNLEFGIYRDGDNNLDESQAATLAQAITVSKNDSDIDFSVEDTTSRHGNGLQTQHYGIADGVVHDAQTTHAVNMASEDNLAQFVAHTLDEAQKSGAKQTWIELSDHGAGDGGGLEADSTQSIMSIDSIAGAIAKGVELHARAHPEDANRRVDGVVANQCLMASLGFADDLSHAGVQYLAASPETMLSPGTPTTVAHAIAQHLEDPSAMANAVVDDVMNFRYRAGAQSWAPAAAFDVLDLAPEKWSGVEHSIKAFNDALGVLNSKDARIVREDGKAVDGMVRFPDATPDMPWHADRPALALYDTIASDGRLNQNVRTLAAQASQTIKATVLAHRESGDFKEFGDADYSNASGPTVHFPVNAGQVDPWAPAVSETDNAFYRNVDGASENRIVA